MALEVAGFGVVGVAVRNDLERDFLRDAPLEAAFEVADDGFQLGAGVGQSAIGIHAETVEFGNLGAPCELGIHFLAVFGLCGESGLEVLGHSDAGCIGVGIEESDGVGDVAVGIGGVVGDVVRDTGGEAVVVDDGGSRAG